MKAWVLDRPGRVTDEGPLRLRDVPDPLVEEGEILVRVSVCGLCRTDLHIVQGELDVPSLPVVPGHQVVGTVVEDGARFPKGTRVGLAWLHETCGACGDCFRGDENLCRNARFTGFHVPGGYAEFVKVPEAFAYALPEEMADEQVAPLLCAGIIGYRAMKQADVEEGESIGLYGFGSSAHIALQVAQHMGCHVYVISRGEQHRELARRMGAEWVGSGDDKVPELLDRALLFAPAGDLVPQALRAVRWGGTVASAAIHMSTIPALDYTRDLFGEKTLRSTTASTRQDGEELLELAGEGVITTQVEVFPFAEANVGLHRILEGKVEGSAVLRVS